MIAPWPLHQSQRHGRWHSSHGAGVGQRNRGALKIRGRSLLLRCAPALTRSSNAATIIGEAHLPGISDIRNKQIAGAVFARHIDSQSEIDFLPENAEQFARRIRCESMIQGRVRLHGLSTIAHPIMCVYESLLFPISAR